MALSITALRTRFLALLNNAPNKIAYVYNTTTYYAMKTVLTRDIKYTDMGAQSGYAFSLLGNASDCSPTPDEIITVGGTQYRVIGVEKDSAEVSIRIDLGQLYV